MKLFILALRPSLLPQKLAPIHTLVPVTLAFFQFTKVTILQTPGYLHILFPQLDIDSLSLCYLF